MKPALCLCADLVARPTTTHLRVAVPDVELKKSTNTGRLLPLLLSNADLVVHGAKDGTFDAARCAPPGTRPAVLFPLEGAPVVDRAFALRAPEPVCLIVLDGTWRQANRLRKQFLVAGVPFVRLPDDALAEPSTYALRHGHFEGSRSTLEAAAAAMAILEGDDAVRVHLLDGLRRMVDRTLWLRGSKAAADVYGGIPAGAGRHSINRV